MAEIRTGMATVTRLAGSKGVSVEEVMQGSDGREHKMFFTVWLGEGHGLNVGDRARFYGFLSVKVTKRDDKTYTDLNINRAQVLEGTLERAQVDESWMPTGGDGS